MYMINTIYAQCVNVYVFVCYRKVMEKAVETGKEKGIRERKEKWGGKRERE